MKKSLLASITLAAMLAPAAAFAEGYGIIEHHTEGVAMGGAAMFIENDAGNMAYNPAGITLCEGEQVKFSATYISPHGHEKTWYGPTLLEDRRNRVHPAWAPGSYYVRKVSDKEWYGLGCFSRFGNMSEFEGGTAAATNNRFARMDGLSITPTYARKSGNKFYWAVGADINYVKLELQKDFTYWSKLGVPTPPAPTGTNQIEGKTWALGWNLGMRYVATKKDEIGFAYHSKIKHSMDADMNCYGLPNPLFGPVHNTARGEVTLPDSYHFGYSHRFDDKNRVELSAIRTQWHNFKELYMSFGKPYLLQQGTTSIHNWKDTWRYAIGYEYKFSKKYTGMLGFAFDDDGIPADGGQFMVPVGIRRTYSAGIKYHDKRHTIALALGWQKEGNQSFIGRGTDAYTSAHCYDSIAKIFSIGYTYHF